jgi:hypothetical protein
MRRPDVFRALGALPLLAFLLLAGCDLLSNKPEIDLEEAIDKAVAHANAPVINVEVDEGGLGTAVPRGVLPGVKLGVPFGLAFNAYNDYSFQGWRALLKSSGDQIANWSPIGATGSDKVQFTPVNAAGTQTNVTVLSNPGDDRILIEPFGTDRPFMVSAYPTGNVVIFNSYVKVSFSTPLDPGTFYFDTQTGRQTDGAGNFKNIHVTPLGQNSTFVDNYFLPPLLSPDGRDLYLWPKFGRDEANKYFGGMSIPLRNYGTRFSVTLSGELRDAGGVEMGTPARFAWSTPVQMISGNEKIDYALPVILDVPSIAMAIKAENAGAPQGSYDLVTSSRYEMNGEYSGNGFDHPGGENWVYFVFQCRTVPRGSDKKLAGDPVDAVSNLPVLGLRMYESKPDGKIKWTEDAMLYRAEPALAASLGKAFLEEATSPSYDTPVYIVKYKVRGNDQDLVGKYADRQVKVYFYPITPLDAIEPGFLYEEEHYANWMPAIVQGNDYADKGKIADARKELEHKWGDGVGDLKPTDAKYDSGWIKEFHFYFGTAPIVP